MQKNTKVANYLEKPIKLTMKKKHLKYVPDKYL